MHRSFPRVLPPSPLSPPLCFNVFNHFSSYCCLLFSGDFAQNNLLVKIIIISLEGKKCFLFSIFRGGKIPLAKTNKSQKYTKTTLLTAFSCLKCIFKKSNSSSKIRQMKLLLQTLLSTDSSLDPAPKTCHVRLRNNKGRI